MKEDAWMSWIHGLWLCLAAGAFMAPLSAAMEIIAQAEALLFAWNLPLARVENPELLSGFPADSS